MYFDAADIGKRVHLLRCCRGISITTLAREMNCSREHLSRAENGKKTFSIDLLIDLADYFHVSLDYLILGNRADSGTDIREELLEVIRELTKIAMQV